MTSPERASLRAYTVASLADAWGCSEGSIRKLIDRGQLTCFRIGTLIRIPADEVRRYECEQTTASSGSEADMPSSGTKEASANGISLPRPTALERKLKQGGFGPKDTVMRGPWAGS